MFSGIVENCIPLNEFNSQGILSLTSPFAEVEEGESIAVNGVCLTARHAASQGEALSFYASPETLAVTNLQKLKAGDYVNLERALTLNTRLSGHLVQGHVDGTAPMQEIKAIGQAYFLSALIPQAFTKYMVQKGSITINGVSLTINDLAGIDGNSAEFMIIPHTWAHTNLSKLKVGSLVNFEVDVLAKHLEKLCTPYLRS